MHLTINGAGFDATLLFTSRQAGSKPIVMNNNTFLSGDVLDIIFYGRNKQYGAYVLRKFYPGRLKRSILIMLGMSLVFSAFTFLPAKKPVTDHSFFVDEFTTRPISTIKDPEKSQAAPARQKRTVPPQQQFTTPAVVNNNTPTTELHDITGLSISDHTDITGTPGTTGDILPAETGNGNGSIPAPPAETENNDPVYNPDIQAEFPGGNAALMKFLQDHLLPPEDTDEPVHVKVRFVVGFDGRLESFDVVESGGSTFSNEVIRVLKLMPQWNPGKKGGRNVRVYYYLPVKFEPRD